MVCLAARSRSAAVQQDICAVGRSVDPMGVAMPQFNVSVPHTLTHEEAHERLNRFIDVLRQKFQDSVNDLDQNWNGDTLNFQFKTFGILLKGGITVEPTQLSVKGEIPFTAMMFRGKIESTIREQLERLMRGEGK
jgi:hypothetical protein